jgi:hypothetical protein
VKPAISIGKALPDKNLLGAALGDISTWRVWLAVLKATFAEPLSVDELAIFKQVAGDRAPPRKRVRELWCGPIGRRSGKSRMSAAVATYIAALIDHSKRLVPGETGIIAVIAASREQAQTVFGYVKGFLQSAPLLAECVESIGETEIKLRGSVAIMVLTNSYRVARGQTLLAVVGDEVSFWRDESTSLPDWETFRAVQPSLLASGGLWVGISTGYRRVGLLYSKHRDHFAQDNDDVLVVSGATETFNPLIDPALIRAAEQADPEAAASEWRGAFRSDISEFLSDELIERCIDYERALELPPRRGYFYNCFVDAAGGGGGSGADSYTICIGHSEGYGPSQRFIIDLVRGTPSGAQFDPDIVTMEYASLLKQYGVRSAVGDHYAAQWVAVAWSRVGVTYQQAELPKSQIYLEALPCFTRNAVSLPNHPKLLRELRLLERRTHRSGRDTVDHGPRGHDDYANAVCGCLRMLSSGLLYDIRKLADAVIPESEAELTPAQRYKEELMRRYGQAPGPAPWLAAREAEKKGNGA